MSMSGRTASIHDRLLAKAHMSESDFNLLLIRYSLERFLYRISASRHKDSFLLKGALLFNLWYDQPRRPTRDADLLGLELKDRDEMARIFKEICDVSCDDGMSYLADSVNATEIREEARYGGIRIDLIGLLGPARCKVQIDVGYGDAVTPAAGMASYPMLLADNPAPFLRVYPKETVIAEKLETIVSLGIANSRMKDYFDLSILLGESILEEDVLVSAIMQTFARRQTSIPPGVPIGLSEDFCDEKAKVSQWRAFLTKNKLEAPSLAAVVGTIRERYLRLRARIPG